MANCQSLLLLSLVWIIILSPIIILGDYITVHSKLDQVVYKLPNQIKSENELGLCNATSVCAAVNRRFWFPSIVYRFCRCPNIQCPFQWKRDNHSIHLDNRSQLKTCENVNYMEPCKVKDVGLIVTEEDKGTKGVVNKKRDIQLKCRCDWPAYWKLTSHFTNLTVTRNEYACAKLNRCMIGDFCGHMRADTFSVYYQCSCPKGTICINTDKMLRNVTELLYEGRVYRAFCTPQDINNKV